MDSNAEQLESYNQFIRTANWTVLDRAVSELVENGDMSEGTSHEYVVGYLCQALAGGEKRSKPTREEMRQIIRAAQKAVRDADPTNRDLLAEFLAERREEAARE